MRIIYLHQYFNTPEMPGATRSYEMARRLVARGHEVDLITSDRDAEKGTPLWRMEDIEGIRVHWTPVAYRNAMGYLTRIKAFFAYAWRAARHAASIDADVVFASSTPLTIALPAAYAARKRHIPMVLEVRDLWPEVPIALGALKDPLTRRLARALERFAYRSSSRVVALAPGMARGVVDTGYPRERVRLIPNACDLDLFGEEARADAEDLRARTPWLGDRPLAAYVGTLGLVNRVDYLVHVAAAARTMDSEVQFATVGTGRESERIRALAAELGVLDVNFHLVGEVPKREAAAWLAASDIALVLAAGPVEALRNSVPNKFFDAIAAGTPVVHNYEGWTETIAEEAGIGFRIDPEDHRAAAERLVEALRDKRWLRRTGTAAHTLAIERFDRDDLTTRLETLLEDAIAETQEPIHAHTSEETGSDAAAVGATSTPPFGRRAYGAIKRAGDAIAAMLGLVVLAPLLAVIALLIRVRMGRGVFFKQVRPGLHGEPFMMYKFRTMLDDTDEDGEPLPDAERLTGLGRFLRSSSLDELPELINVLAGDMSLVGPRPLLTEYVPLYNRQQARRHEVRPGITGWAQVNGRNAIDWEQKFDFDVYYVDHLSPWLDCKILFLTARKVLAREGISQEGEATAAKFTGTGDIEAREEGAS